MCNGEKMRDTGSGAAAYCFRLEYRKNICSELVEPPTHVKSTVESSRQVIVCVSVCVCLCGPLPKEVT